MAPRPALATAARAAAILLAGASCGESLDTLHVDSSALDIEIGFLVEIEADAVSRVGAPFGLGAAPFGKATFERADRRRELYLVSIDHEDLRAAVPGYDASRAAEITISDRGRLGVAPDEHPARVTLPEGTRMHAVDLRAGTLTPLPTPLGDVLEALVLVVPTDPEYCERGLETLARFGAHDRLLVADSLSWTDRGINDASFHAIYDLVPLSADRVVLMTRILLFVLDRGGVVAEPGDAAAGPSRTFHRRGLELEDAIFRAVARDPTDGSLWAAGSAVDGEEGFVAHLSLGEAGLERLEVVRRDEDGGAFPPMRDVTVDAAGGVLAVGGNLQAYFRPPAAAGFRVVTLPFVPLQGEDEDETNLAVASGDPRAPHIVGLKGDALLLGDAATDRFDLQWIRHIDERPLGVTPFLEDLALTSNGERWAAGRGSILSGWRRSDGWVPLPFAYNPRIDACTQGADINGSGIHFVSVAADEAHVFAVADRCNAVVVHDRNRGCTAVLELPDEPAEQSSSEPLRRLFHDGERVWLTGQLGRLFTLERP